MMMVVLQPLIEHIGYALLVFILVILSRLLVLLANVLLLMLLIILLSVSAHYLELNRFTINSINHNHTNASRVALRDDNNNPIHYWLRSAGLSTGAPVAAVWPHGSRGATIADNAHLGFRPSSNNSLAITYTSTLSFLIILLNLYRENIRKVLTIYIYIYI